MLQTFTNTIHDSDMAKIILDNDKIISENNLRRPVRLITRSSLIDIMIPSDKNNEIPEILKE